MRSLRKILNDKVELDVKLSEKDIQALRIKNTSMKTTDYLEFLKSVNSIGVDVKWRKGPRGKRFELP